MEAGSFEQAGRQEKQRADKHEPTNKQTQLQATHSMMQMAAVTTAAMMEAANILLCAGP
jgi:hypothetical protein